MLGAAGVVGLAACVSSPDLAFRSPMQSVASVAAAVIPVAILWACYRTTYEIGPSQLVIRFGPITKSIDLAAITRAAPSRNPLSAPAPSLDRVRIDYRRASGSMAFTFLSPENKQAFLHELREAVPALREGMI